MILQNFGNLPSMQIDAIESSEEMSAERQAGARTRKKEIKNVPPRYVLGGVGFRTKGEVAARARAVLWGAPIDVCFETGSDENHFLRDLIEWHPDAPKKIGPGIEAFSVSVTSFHRGARRGDRQFNLHRVDGFTDNFSYKKCLHPGSHRQCCLEAFRNAIRPQIDEMRIERVLAEGLDPMDHDIHHETPLAEMVASFLGECGIAFDDIALKADGAGSYCEELADSLLLQRWQEHHRATADLKVLSKTEHHRIPTRAIAA